MPAPTVASRRASRSSNVTRGRQQTSLDGWLEPPVQVRASYQDAGLERHGVVGNMAPLGTMPKLGNFTVRRCGAATPSPAPPEILAPTAPSRKIILKRPSHSAWTASATAASSAIKAAPAQPRSPAAPEEDEDETETDTDDEDRATPSRHIQEASLDLRPASPPPQAHPRGLLQGTTPANMDSNSWDKVMELAVTEAMAHHRYPTAYALRHVYEGNKSDPRFLSLLWKLCSQTADPEAIAEWSGLVQAKKRQGRRDKTAFFWATGRMNQAADDDLDNPDLASQCLRAGHDEPGAGTGRQQLRRSHDSPTPVRVPEAIPGEPDLARDRPSDCIPFEPALEDGQEKQPKNDSDRWRCASKTQFQTRHHSSTRRLGIDWDATTMSSNGETPSGRIKRRTGSVSSMSSLSSLDELGNDNSPLSPVSAADPIASCRPHELQAPARQEDTDEPSRLSQSPRRVVPCASVTKKAKEPAGEARVTRQRTSAAALRNSPATLCADSRPAQPQDPAAVVAGENERQEAYDMPAEMKAVFPDMTKKAAKAVHHPIFPSKFGKPEEKDPNHQYRKKAQETTNGAGAEHIALSFVREPRDENRLTADEATIPVWSVPGHKAGRARNERAANANVRGARASGKRTFDEMDNQPTSSNAVLPASETLSAAATSRGGTPVLRAAKKLRLGLRVKLSPMKKKTGTSAGIPCAHSDASSPLPTGAPVRDEDNDDFCSACSGNGELVCCDGCTRSFHFLCMDPPIEASANPDGEWFCHGCRMARAAARPPLVQTLFSGCLEKLAARNPSSFRLPQSIRDYFEDVKTGAEGEYEDTVAAPKPTKKRKNDEDPALELVRLRDAEGKPILCHQCAKSSVGGRPIIPCSVCRLHWHLDCLDPPLAVPPVLRTWRCPAHAEDLLAKLPGSLAPAHKYRKIKHAPVIQPAYPRAFVTNGYIDVDLDDSEDESGWKNYETFGRTVRLPEKGIELNFLSRLRQHGKPRAASKSVGKSQTGAQPTVAVSRTYTFEEQQVANNLALLSGQGSENITSLIDALVHEAPPAMISFMSRLDGQRIASANFSRMDTQALWAILAQLDDMKKRVETILYSAGAEQLSTPASGPDMTVDQADTHMPSLQQSLQETVGAESNVSSSEKVLPSPAATVASTA